MALDEYRSKRDFSKSPEPPGSSPAERRKSNKGKLFFCVQKHLASHLHYDLRLEWRGVLMSWAVPKGPSLDPTTKRLAMKVEDHPVEYGTFEGVIPEGYGAGIVMLWDRGTWEPETDDIDAALAKGELKFKLDGYKLKGSWVIVRTRRGAADDGRQWLLIKHRDEWAGPVDIAEFAPHSVKSNGDFADILAQENPDIWRSNRPARGGEAGAMLQKIIERALALREAARGDQSGAASHGSGTRASARDSASRRRQATSRRTGRPSRTARPARKSQRERRETARGK